MSRPVKWFVYGWCALVVAVIGYVRFEYSYLTETQLFFEFLAVWFWMILGSALVYALVNFELRYQRARK